MRLRSLLRIHIRFISEAVKKMMSQPALPAKASLCCNTVQTDTVPTYAMYETLKELCQSNAEFFGPDQSENGQRMYQGFVGLADHIDAVWPLVDRVRKIAPAYDFDANSPGNGYRSFVSVVDSCILHGVKLGRTVSMSRDGLLFRKSYYVREIEACGQLLASLCTCMQHVCTLMSWAPTGELFPLHQHSPEELFSQADTINQYCFYGRCLGFQFLPSMRGILKGISICMAGFSEAYYSNGNIISSMWTGGQYVIDPELRARRIVNISQCASVDFCKAFWFLAESEIMQRIPSLVSATVAVNKVISIPPEKITVKGVDGRDVTLNPPDAHIGLRTLGVRLISATKRRGMVGEGSSGAAPSKGLLFHCHGGGFVSQSSKSHEVYLREWAAKMDVPIVSVDYSLAPQAPYPRALQEVFYAYCWVLKNCHLLGSTGARIVMAGDSAGANLIAGCTLRAADHGVRAPSGLFLAYAPLLVSFVPSPARLLCLMDPLLPFGFMMRCLKAYACPPPKEKEKMSTTEASISNATTPLESNGFLKVSPSRELSAACSWESMSPSDPASLQAHKSGSERRISLDTTVSATSLQSDQRTLTNVSATSLQTNATVPEADTSQQYVADFLERYVLDSDTDSEGLQIPILRKKAPDLHQSRSDSSTLVDEEPLERASSKGIQKRISLAAGSIASAFSTTIASMTTSNKISEAPDDIRMRTSMDALIARSPSDEFIFSVPCDPYLSPYFADDEKLKKFPPVRILTVHLDPCLDDCVMFAKKLKQLGTPVGLDVLEGLPHGFLNFSLMSKEANEGSELCTRRMMELLNADEVTATNQTTGIGNL